MILLLVFFSDSFKNNAVIRNFSISFYRPLLRFICYGISLQKNDQCTSYLPLLQLVLSSRAKQISKDPSIFFLSKTHISLTSVNKNRCVLFFLMWLGHNYTHTHTKKKPGNFCLQYICLHFYSLWSFF